MCSTNEKLAMLERLKPTNMDIEETEGEQAEKEAAFDDFLKALKPSKQAANAFKTPQDLTAAAEVRRDDEAVDLQALEKILAGMKTSENNARHQARRDNFSCVSFSSDEGFEARATSETTSFENLDAVEDFNTTIRIQNT